MFDEALLHSRKLAILGVTFDGTDGLAIEDLSKNNRFVYITWLRLRAAGSSAKTAA
jgi:hypothetical protein